MYSILCHNFNVRVGTVHLGMRAHGTVHTAHVLTYDLIKMLDTYFL